MIHWEPSKVLALEASTDVKFKTVVIVLVLLPDVDDEAHVIPHIVIFCNVSPKAKGNVVSRAVKSILINPTYEAVCGRLVHSMLQRSNMAMERAIW